MCTKASFILCVMDVYMAWSDRINESSRKNASSAPRKLACSQPWSDPPAMDYSPPHGWAVASPDDTLLGAGAGCWSVAASTPPCHHIGSSADASPYDSAEEGAACGESAWAPAGLNAGEAVDMALHDWATAPAGGWEGDLEAFGRSGSL
jgi:hypothetical protein